MISNNMSLSHHKLSQSPKSIPYLCIIHIPFNIGILRTLGHWRHLRSLRFWRWKLLIHIPLFNYRDLLISERNPLISYFSLLYCSGCPPCIDVLQTQEKRLTRGTYKTQLLNKVKLLSPNSLSLMGVLRLTPMNKILLDVASETFNPKIFPKTLCSDTKFITTRKYTLEVRATLISGQGVLDLLKVLY